VSEELAEEREREESLARIRQGGLPLRAERRLRDLAEHGGFFTSDLTVSAFALCAQAGLRPISQVMGSCVYHVGFAGRPYYGGRYGYNTNAVGGELDSLSEAWNAARELALSRLRQEAEHCGADTVIGVQITKGSWDFVAGAIEFVAIGTAVRHDQDKKGAGPPVLTDLSVADYVKLRRAGYETLGVVGGTTVYYVIPSLATQQVQATRLWGPGSRNQELTDLTQGLYAAREMAMARVSAGAERLRASGVVGVSFEQTLRTYDVENTGFGRPGAHRDLQITLHVLGTAVRERQRFGGEPRPDLPITTVIRLKG
jgi:uncharacterized protein YbjQ (UPF0145 family)